MPKASTHASSQLSASRPHGPGPVHVNFLLHARVREPSPLQASPSPDDALSPLPFLAACVASSQAVVGPCGSPGVTCKPRVVIRRRPVSHVTAHDTISGIMSATRLQFPWIKKEAVIASRRVLGDPSVPFRPSPVLSNRPSCDSSNSSSCPCPRLVCDLVLCPMLSVQVYGKMRGARKM